MLATHKVLARKIEQLEATQEGHSALLAIVVTDIQNLDKRLKAPRQRKPRIGFYTEK